MFIKNIVCFISFISIFQISNAQNQIVGKWQNEEKSAIVEIYENNNKYYGKIVTLKNVSFKKDINNPNPKKRSAKLIGLTILKDLEYNKKEWTNGSVYSPTNGETYKCKIWLQDSYTLIGKGFYGILSKTQIWKKVS